ncbi:MFS transporter [Hydrogenophaga sp.]|uniref:MFS transporter n=1 Tax=Hydrogenophaga sp. TaxID=1904254 RepID=UPI00262805BB|nr:MFS transporter [Hydrogenophaga sp.]MCW5654951.1 MFS transporter [Hydrogenophaga sp.]
MKTSAGAAPSAEPIAGFGGPGAWRDGLRYGLLGMPLAFVALPLYVVLPNHYAREFGAPLALLGAALLGARLIDALLDPWIGRWSDRLIARSVTALMVATGSASVVLALSLWGLFFPPPEILERGQGGLLAWAGAVLSLAYTAYSVIAVSHQAWGARLGGSETQRSRVVAWREGFALAGVLLAAVLPGTLGMGAMVACFAVLLALGWWSWSGSPVPPRATARSCAGPSPLRQPAFQRLLAVFVLNGIASAIPATLVLFFAQDRLQAPASLEPAFLGTYFLCAALSLPLWVRLVERWGLARTWLAGMAMAVAAFAWTAGLGTGDVLPFLLVCAVSGVALGTDLALPGAMLAGLIGQLGERGRREGAYFGWWNFATKMNLALAAGLALPLLAWLGYAPGARDATALNTLTLAYCLLPCLLKLAAGVTLYLLVIRPERLVRATAAAQVPTR